MILNQRPGEPIGAALDRAVESGRIGAADAEQVELFSEFLTYAGHAPGHPDYRPTEAQARWLCAFLRTERGARFYADLDSEAGYALAARIERSAWRLR